MSATTTTLTVYRGFVGTGAYVWSPFVTKLETRLRLAGVPYRVEPGSMRQAPRAKIPYVGGFSDSSPGDLMGDTALITRKLVGDGVLPDLNASGALTPAQQAQDAAVRALLEDKLYFYLVRERWLDNYYTMRPATLAALPYPMQILVGNIAYSGVKRTLYGQGTGRYTDDEVRQFKLDIWEHLSALLADARVESQASSAAGGGSAASMPNVKTRSAASAGAGIGDNSKKPFWVLGKDEPTEADATVFGFIVSGLVCAAAPETQKVVRRFPVLVDYARRIHDEYFSDYDIWADKVE